MNKRLLKNVLILLLASGSIFLVSRYFIYLQGNIFTLKDNLSLLENQRQSLLQEIEKEKTTIQGLNNKNAGLRDYLKASHGRLSRSFEELGRAQEQIDRLGVQFSVLKAENSALLEERNRLTREIETLKSKPAPAEPKKPVRKGKQKQPASEKIKIEVMPAAGPR